MLPCKGRDANAQRHRLLPRRDNQWPQQVIPGPQHGRDHDREQAWFDDGHHEDCKDEPEENRLATELHSREGISPHRAQNQLDDGSQHRDRHRHPKLFEERKTGKHLGVIVELPAVGNELRRDGLDLHVRRQGHEDLVHEWEHHEHSAEQQQDVHPDEAPLRHGVAPLGKGRHLYSGEFGPRTHLRHSSPISSAPGTGRGSRWQRGQR